MRSARRYPLLGGPFDGHRTDLQPVPGDTICVSGEAGYMESYGEVTYLPDVDALCWRYDDPADPAISLAVLVVVSA